MRQALKSMRQANSHAYWRDNALDATTFALRQHRKGLALALKEGKDYDLFGHYIVGDPKPPHVEIFLQQVVDDEINRYVPNFYKDITLIIPWDKIKKKSKKDAMDSLFAKSHAKAMESGKVMDVYNLPPPPKNRTDFSNRDES